MGCFTRAEMFYYAALMEMFSVSFLEFGVLLLVHRLNPDVGVDVWLKVMLVST